MIDEIDDFIDAWHDRNHDGLPLHEYLGMTEDEYAVSVMDFAAMTLLRTTRNSNRPLVPAVEAYVKALSTANDPRNRGPIIALSAWLGKHHGDNRKVA